MICLSISDSTAEGRQLLDALRKSRAVTIHKHPNAETRQALRDAKAGKVKKVNDVSAWLRKLIG